MAQEFRKAWFPAKKSARDLTVNEIMMLLFGILGTMPIIVIRGNTLFMYLFMLMIALGGAYALVEYKSFEIRRVSLWPLAIAISGSVGAMLCMTGSLPFVFRDGEGMRIVWEILYAVFFVLLCTMQGREQVRYYIKGVYIASVIQAFYCLAQLAYFELTKSTLNHLIFERFLGMQSNFGFDAGKMDNGRVMLSGFCWHPANLAPLLTIGYLCSDSWVLKLIFVLVGSICGNRTTLLGLGICVLGEGIWYLKTKGFQIRFNVWTARLSLFGILAAAAYFVLMDRSLIRKVSDMISFYIEKTDYTHNLSTGAHLDYWFTVPKGFREVGPLQFLFGLGPECSGYIGTKILNMYPDQKWVLECDYINILWSYGLLGLILRYTWYIRESIKSQKKNSAHWVFVAAIGIMGIFYNVMFNWVIIFIYAVIILNMDTDTSKEVSTESVQVV
ncbi:MAG: hypothetical protein K5739_05550 [Lachnospiraceae bacterium]|nr:hypothetical protein [Lachnospiraceae bacterium]